MSSHASRERRVYVGSLAELMASGALWVPLSPDASGRPREAIVVVDEQAEPRAYLNLCRHLPIPLDAGSRRFLHRGELQCLTHGARYRLSDGLCIGGPCRGESLRALALEHESGFVYVIDEPA